MTAAEIRAALAAAETYAAQNGKESAYNMLVGWLESAADRAGAAS